nr:hypothetical protein [Kofleriaceae bacterium]
MYGLELRAPARGDDRIADGYLRLARTLTGVDLKRTKRGGASFQLFPGVRVRLELDGDEVIARAATAGVGAGYHLAVLRALDDVAAALELEWSEPAAERDVAVIEREMCEWVGEAIAAGTTSFGMPKHRVFRVAGAAVMTPLGPRATAWRDAVVADPAAAVDAFAWRRDEPGQLERARALHAMWQDLPWRVPLDDGERAAMKAAEADLRAALRANRDLDMPWPDWAALCDHLDLHGKVSDAVRERAGSARATIGYRRHDLEVDLPGGWRMVHPGAFVGGWEDDDTRYVATDGKRSVSVTTLTAEGEADPNALLDVAPERFDVVARVGDGDRRGRAEATMDHDVRVLHGLMAIAPHVAIITVRCTPSDDPWAIATWRSLDRANS